MIGSLGDVVFVASHDQLRTFDAFQRSGSPRLAEHEVIGRKAQLEFQAAGLETISFQMRLDAMYGVAPLKECRTLRELRDIGRIVPLVIGGVYFGEWVIASLSESHKRHDGAGNVLLAVVDVQLKEVAAVPQQQAENAAAWGEE